mgnify:CR=1 FL=1
MNDLDYRIQSLQSNVPLPVSKQSIKTKKSICFKDVFQEVQSIKVSKHAQNRLLERNIQLNEKQWNLISEKMIEAKQKGITDSLVIIQDAALLVNTKNNTVITVLNAKESTNIFTNINGTILINE